MAMMDNVTFLVSHIRNSFITSDDTGMSELILDTDDLCDRHPVGSDKRPTTWPGKGSLGTDSSFSDGGMETDTELSHSYDILPDMDFASHRRRSNTAQRLEKLKREKHKQSKIKHITWKDVDVSGLEIGDYFEKKEVRPAKSKTPKLSRLTEQLDNFAAANNPFMEYARFDGRIHISAGMPTKKIDIFLTMAPPDQRGYPMTVVTLATAKVQDLIGLICWQYTAEVHQPPLRENLEAFSLHIAEDDGDVDMDFPALDNREPISKFGFAKLALVEKDLPLANSAKPSVVVTINMPHRGFSKILVDSNNLTMRDILKKVLNKRKLRQVKGPEYTLEHQTEPGVPIDLDTPLNSLDTLEFCLVRENSIREDIGNADNPANESAMAESLSSHQYRSYRVNMLHKVRTNTEIQLGISGDKIEIDPTTKSKLFKQSPSTYDTDSIAACTLLDGKSSGKSTFRLVYKSVTSEYKHHDFESDVHVAKEITSKVNNILEMRSSPVRKEFMTQRERKLQKRHTIGF